MEALCFEDFLVACARLRKVLTISHDNATAVLFATFRVCGHNPTAVLLRILAPASSLIQTDTICLHAVISFMRGDRNMPPKDCNPHSKDRKKKAPTFRTPHVGALEYCNLYYRNPPKGQ